MKKVIVLSAVLFAATLTVTSCDKKADAPATETVATDSITETVTEPAVDSTAAATTTDSATTTTTEVKTATEVKK